MSKHQQPTKGRRKDKQQRELLEQLHQEWLERTKPTDRFTQTPNEKEITNVSNCD